MRSNSGLSIGLQVRDTASSFLGGRLSSPKRWIQAQETVHIAKVNIGKDVELVAMHNSYPKGTLGDPTDSLARGRDSVVNLSPSRKLRSEQNLSVSGAPAKRIIVDDSDGDEVIIDLMVVSGDNFYQAIIGSPKGSENSPDVQRFLSSFALVAR